MSGVRRWILWRYRRPSACPAGKESIQELTKNNETKTDEAVEKKRGEITQV